MPTGYTAKLMEEGQTFPDFVMLCARAMGATIMMRDEPMNAPISKFEPSDYHTKAGTEAKAKLARLQSMDKDSRIAFGEKEKRDEIKRHREWLAREEAENDRLEGMLEQVEAWTPPTAEHEGLKSFMLEQIKISMNSLDYQREAIARAEDKSPVDYYAEATANARRDIEYHAAENAKEIGRTDSRNAWVDQLRESLEEPDPCLG